MITYKNLDYYTAPIESLIKDIEEVEAHESTFYREEDGTAGSFLICIDEADDAQEVFKEVWDYIQKEAPFLDISTSLTENEGLPCIKVEWKEVWE